MVSMINIQVGKIKQPNRYEKTKLESLIREETTSITFWYLV